MVERGAARDLAEPRALAAAARVVALPAAQRGLERLRRQVVGGRPVARQVQDVAEDVAEVALGECGHGAVGGGGVMTAWRICMSL